MTQPTVLVVEDDAFAVLREVDVAFDGVDAHAPGQVEGHHGVLGGVALRAPVPDDPGSAGRILPQDTDT